MHITRPEFDRAAETVLLHPEQARRLWDQLELCADAAIPPPLQAVAAPAAPRFDLAHLLYYFGALIVLGSMGWFMTTVWEIFGGGGIFAIATAYAVCFAVGGRYLWAKSELRTPGGLLVTLAVGMVPLMIYGLERAVGFGPLGNPGRYSDFHQYIRGGWIFMELGTVAAGLLALRWVRFPFLTLPIAFTLWYMSMDLAPLVFGEDSFSWHIRQWVSLWFGLAMLLTAYLVDVRRRWQGLDYGFWLSLFGLIAFWGGLTMLDSSSEWRRLLYGLINLGLMVIGTLLDRRGFVVFGALGVNFYLGHLAWGLFKDSALFPFVLSAFGLLIIVVGVLYQRRRAALRQSLLRLLPTSWLYLLPQR